MQNIGPETFGSALSSYHAVGCARDGKSLCTRLCDRCPCSYFGMEYLDYAEFGTNRGVGVPVVQNTEAEN